MPFPLDIAPTSFVLDHAVGGTVEASLRTAVLADIDTWNRTWRPFLHGRPDGAWPWRTHVERAATTPGYLCLAVARGVELDALMSLSLDKSVLSPGADLVYVEYVGVAPNHQRPPVGRRAIRGLGTLLVRAAVAVSFDMGLAGRVGLHSKKESEPFYRDGLRLREVGIQPTDDGMWLYFEGGPEEAMRLLGHVSGR